MYSRNPRVLEFYVPVEQCVREEVVFLSCPFRRRTRKRRPSWLDCIADRRASRRHISMTYLSYELCQAKELVITHHLSFPEPKKKKGSIFRDRKKD